MLAIIVDLLHTIMLGNAVINHKHIVFPSFYDSLQLIFIVGILLRNRRYCCMVSSIILNHWGASSEGLRVVLALPNTVDS